MQSTTTIKLKSYMEQIATQWGFDKMKHPRIPLEEEITASQQPQNDKDKHFMDLARAHAILTGSGISNQRDWTRV